MIGFCIVLWFLDKHTVQYAAFSMVDRASKLVISVDNASEDTTDDWDLAWLIASTGVPKLFLLEADGLEVKPGLNAFMPNL